MLPFVPTNALAATQRNLKQIIGHTTILLVYVDDPPMFTAGLRLNMRTIPEAKIQPDHALLPFVPLLIRLS